MSKPKLGDGQTTERLAKKLEKQQGKPKDKAKDPQKNYGSKRFNDLSAKGKQKKG